MPFPCEEVNSCPDDDSTSVPFGKSLEDIVGNCSSIVELTFMTASLFTKPEQYVENKRVQNHTDD
jgi:hypothetical protein